MFCSLVTFLSTLREWCCHSALLQFLFSFCRIVILQICHIVFVLVLSHCSDFVCPVVVLSSRSVVFSCFVVFVPYFQSTVSSHCCCLDSKCFDFVSFLCCRVIIVLVLSNGRVLNVILSNCKILILSKCNVLVVSNCNVLVSIEYVDKSDFTATERRVRTCF